MSACPWCEIMPGDPDHARVHYCRHGLPLGVTCDGCVRERFVKAALAAAPISEGDKP